MGKSCGKTAGKNAFLGVKNIVKIVLVIIGTLVGAVFASGKEIYSFFYIYGEFGFLGMFISSSLIGIIIYKVFKICDKARVNSYQGFCEYIGKWGLNKNGFLNSVVNIFLLITFFVMVAGFSSFLNQEFGINRIVGSVVIIGICYIIFLNNINGLIKLSNYLIPILIVFIVYISMFKIGFKFKLINLSVTFNDNGCEPYISVVKTVTSAIIYSCYNSIILIPILIPIKNTIEEKKNYALISVISSLIIFLLSVSVFNLLLNGNDSILKLEMPAISVVGEIGGIYKITYSMIIGISIITSAISAGCGFLNNGSSSTQSYKRNLRLMLIITVFVSQISFSTLVSFFYPVLGIFGFLEMLLIL